MIVKSARPSSNAGPETAGPSTTMIVGTRPEQAASADASRPQAWSAGIPSTMSEPALEITSTTGSPTSWAVRSPISIFDDVVDDRCTISPG